MKIGTGISRFLIVFTLLGLLSSFMPVAAQEPQPPTPAQNPFFTHNLPERQGPDSMRQDAEGLWYVPAMDADAAEIAQNPAPTAAGGPDDYGYVWTDPIPSNWIDVSTGLNVDVNYPENPIAIGFPFKFYENTYSQLYISKYGYVSFDRYGMNRSQSEIPDASLPNNVIAPHWSPINSVGGYVRYQNGGSAPNRWFVIEWNRVKDNSYNEEYTFEAILYENGNIIFQYGMMNASGNGRWCESSGIEDSYGTTGLAITPFCYFINSNHAVQITRPAPGARVSIRPLFQGQFTAPGNTAVFQVPVRNLGELGTDTYDLTLTSTWPALLFKADGVTPLTDTDGDGSPDTGPLVEGAGTTIVARVQPPFMANIAANNTTEVTARSSTSLAVSKTAVLNATVPAAFAQAYTDFSDGALSLYLAQPAEQVLRYAAAFGNYGQGTTVVEAPNGNLLYAWSDYRCLDSACNIYLREIFYSLLNHKGEIIRQPAKLADLGSPADRIYDNSVTIAAAPNGQFGFLWNRTTHNGEKHISNLMFATVDAAGNLSSPPVVITDNVVWGTWQDYGIPSFYSNQITATGDNRFVLAWEKYTRQNNGSFEDIFYAIRDTANNPVVPVVQFTHDTADYNQYYGSPTIAALNNNRVLLGWLQRANNSYNLAYAILDSSGTVVRPTAILSDDYGRGIHAAQLSSGQIALAWQSYNSDKPQIAFAILDGGDYSIRVSPTLLNNPAAISGDAYVSVTADQAGHAILTWTDDDYASRTNLYYALIHNNGSVLTQPMIFRSSVRPGNMEIHYEGGGNTSYTTASSSLQVDALVSAPTLVGALPQGTAVIPIAFSNTGQTPALGITITVTLDPNLVYSGNTLGIEPVIVVGSQGADSASASSTLTWTLPGNLNFMGCGKFMLSVTVPDGAVGTRFPVSVQITTEGTDGNPENNIANLNIMISRQSYLPAVRR